MLVMNDGVLQWKLTSDDLRKHGETIFRSEFCQIAKKLAGDGGRFGEAAEDMAFIKNGLNPDTLDTIDMCLIVDENQYWFNPKWSDSPV